MVDDVKSRTAQMFDAMSSSYDAIVPFFAEFGELLVDAAGVEPGDRTLDVATGTGACLIPAARAVGDRGVAVGIDLSEGMLEQLRRASRAAGLEHVRVELMDAEHIEFPDESFDVVTCAFAVFLFPDRPRALGEFARVLRPGGTVAFSTFANDALGYPWFAEVVAPFLPDDGPPADAAQRFLHMDPDAFAAGLREVGFDAVSSRVVERHYHFASPAEHWDWLVSNGHRTTIERVDPADLGLLKAAIEARLEPHRDAVGYRFDKPIRFTLAQRIA